VDLKCAFHKERLPYQEYHDAGRHEMVRGRLEESGLAVSVFAQWSGLHLSPPKRPRTDVEELGTRILDEIDVLAEALRLPQQLLLWSRYLTCGR
jgi:hypothetical protein